MYAVRIARQRRWFPSVEELLEFAAEAPVPKRALLEEPKLSPEEARKTARAGLEMIEAELKKRGLLVKRIA